MQKVEINSERYLNPRKIYGEIWRFILTTERGRTYYLSSYGRVKLVYKKGKTIILRPYINSSGYYRVKIENRNEFLHRIVAIAFVENGLPALHKYIDHRDNDKSNNTAKNLKWVSIKQNANNPITKWARDMRWGMTIEEMKPDATQTYHYLPEKKARVLLDKYFGKRRGDEYLKKLLLEKGYSL